MLPEYEIHDGIKYPVLGRKKGNELTDPCPYCGKRHRHGIPEGHRIRHCANTKNSMERGKGFFASDGTYFDPEVSYIIREY